MNKFNINKQNLSDDEINESQQKEKENVKSP